MWKLFATIMLVLILLNTCSINQAIHRISPMPSFSIAYASEECCEEPLKWEVFYVGILKEAFVNYKEGEIALTFDLDEGTVISFSIPFKLLVQKPEEIVELGGQTVVVEVGFIEKADGDIVVCKVRINPLILE